MKTNRKCCGNCKWHHHEDIDDGYICVNADSECCADWTEHSYCCSEWEEEDENTCSL